MSLFNYIEVSPNEYEFLASLGFIRISTEYGPRMICSNGFSEVLISKTNNDEFEYDYIDLDHHHTAKVYKTFKGLKARLTPKK